LAGAGPRAVKKPAWRLQTAPLLGFGLAPVVALIGALGLAPLQAAAGLLGAPYRDAATIARRQGAWLWALAALLAWIGVSALWSPVGDVGVRYAKLAAGVLCALAFAAACHAALGLTRALLAAGMGALAALLLIEAATGMALNRLVQPGEPLEALARNPARGVCVLVLWLAPALAILLARRTAVRIAAAAALLLAAVWLSPQFYMSANAAALVAAAVGAGLGYALPRLAPAALGALAAAWLLAAPVLLPLVEAPGDWPLSWRMRERIWEFAAARIAEKPLAGWGFAASRSFPERGEIEGLSFGLIPLHPHSGSLQIWLELGLIGAGLAAAALVAAGFAARRRVGRDRRAAAAVCGFAAAALVIANVSFGLWQEWWVAAVAFGAVAASVVKA